MAFCNKCGNQLPDGANNCPNCGAPAGNTQQNTQNAQDFVNNMMNTNDTTSQFDPQDINNNKGMSVLAYIGFLFLVPLLACPNSKFARYHTNQGLVLFLLEFALGVVTGILGIIRSYNRRTFKRSRRYLHSCTYDYGHHQRRTGTG